jgi:hypothetical protein
MDIPAKKICDQLEQQIAKLRSAVSNKDKQSVSESVAVIEAYCQLLKSPSTKDVTPQVTQKDYSMSTQAVSSVEQEVEGRNLLEF